MRTLYSVLLLTFFVSYTSFAQTGELQGKVLDAETGKGIGFTPVVVLQNGTQRGGGYTDDFGNFVIKPIQPGTYTIKTSFTGYNPVEVNGVVVSSDKITFQDITMSKTVTTIQEVVITAEPKLVDPDRTQQGDTKTRTEIQQLATNRNNPNDIIGTAAGVFQSDAGSGISVGGSRTSSNKYYVDGIPMRGTINLPSQAVEQLTLISGGIPAKYGDATGGIVNITTRGPSREFFGGVEGATSQFLDPYGYNLLNFSLAGPLLSRNRKTDSADTRLGFFITAEFETNRDADPSAVGMWKVKDDVLNDIKARPLQPAEIGTGFVQRAAFLTKDDLEKIDAKQNVSDQALRFSTKFDVKLNQYTNVTVGGNADLQEYNNYDLVYQLFAPEHNLNIRDRTFRGFVRFTQRFAQNVEKENAGGTSFQNAYYSIQADYTKYFQNFEDKNVGNNPFHYGYVGKFKTEQAPTYVFGQDEATGLWGQLLQGYIDTAVTFQPGTLTPDLTAYTTNFYELAGSSLQDGIYGLNGDRSFFQSLGVIENAGGLINGQLPGDIYSLWRPTGYQAGEIRKIDNTQYRLSFSGSVDVVSTSNVSKGDKNRHALEFGFEYEQRDDRGWRVFPVDANGLWGLARQSTNGHLLLDLENPNPVMVDGVFQDTINYDYMAGPGQSFFDYQLRQKLGIADNAVIDVDNLNPDDLSIDMFSPDELFTSTGNTYIQYWGYDWKGN
ncbi:MAG TPA: carboxypeptidase regulatory-like domain-containing protein, partial [Chitinophagales bacterium]|nr:carboxypeptidase regulatory-like domain-containing protein [Chitinophagales bacterium]